MHGDPLQGGGVTLQCDVFILPGVRALWLEDRRLSVRDTPTPEPPPGEALVRVVRTGICNTDIELTRGYYPFTAATRVRARSILFASVTSSWQARTVPPFLAGSAAARSPLAASRSEHHVVSAARQLATHFEPDPAVRTGDERHRGSLSPARFPSPPYRSVHTASSLPLGSVKWNRRPPGKENVGFTIFPPASLTFASTSSSRVA